LYGKKSFKEDGLKKKGSVGIGIEKGYRDNASIEQFIEAITLK